jgi:predicted nucleic acid-binding protein
VLDESISLIFKRETYNNAHQFVQAVLASAEKGQLKVERVDSSRFLAAWELRKRYHDKPRISFTDLTSIVIMRELGINQVLTEDEHFMHVGLGFIRVP